MKTFAYIIGALFAGLVAGMGAGGALVLFAPCSWFGSSFEGACGYGGLFAGFALGIAVAAITAISLIVFLFRSGGPEAPRPDFPEHAKGLTIVWAGMLYLEHDGAMRIIGSEFGDMGATALGMASLIAFIGLSAALARAIGKHPVVALSALVPHFGALITAVILFWRPITGQIKVGYDHTHDDAPDASGVPTADTE